uniref:Uncharacterized protein n=1 Tax=Siphoviridae sp. ctOqH1 TaxID=2826316 RepID=A0A8S5NCG1_9CAUD|nr:MAG TPA: hypothetical protein [Siphoviridae sp. ctOqH1]
MYFLIEKRTCSPEITAPQKTPLTVFLRFDFL